MEDSDTHLAIKKTVSQMRTFDEETKKLSHRSQTFELASEANFRDMERKPALARHPPRASLDSLPDDILYDIFQRLRFQRHANLEAILVSKRIYQFIMNTPLLWTRIEFDVSGDLSKERILHRSYIEACMERSQGADLDIEIKLGWETKETIIAQDGTNALLNPVDNSGVFQSTLDKASCIMYERKEAAVYELLDAIVGVNGCNMYQWRSLFLSLPTEYSQAASVIQRFVGDSPNLRKLDIQNSFIPYCDYLDSWKGTFPDVSGLHSFRSDHRAPWALSTLNPVMIRELNITIWHPHDFEKLASYRALQYLEIGWSGRGKPSDPAIFLPSLRILHIKGSYPYLLSRLQTGALDKLSITAYGIYLKRPLPTAAVVQWNFQQYPLDDNLHKIIRLLSDILTNLRGTAKLLLFACFTKEAVLNIVHELKRTTSFPQELYTIIFLSYPEGI